MQKERKITLSRSTFPQQIDSFKDLYDLPASMVTQAKRYQELKMKPTLSSVEQTELNGLTTHLSDFIITPETWNKFGDSLVSMQTFIKTGIDGYIGQKQTEWASYVNAFHLIGVYSATKAYKFQNMVTYNGDLYLCLQDTTAGTAPTDATKWQKISTKGDKGDIGLNLAYRGLYDNTKTYVLGDAVSFTDGLLYYANTSVSAGETPSASTKWTLWDRQIVSKTQPAKHAVGTIWIKTDS